MEAVTAEARAALDAAFLRLLRARYPDLLWSIKARDAGGHRSLDQLTADLAPGRRARSRPAKARREALVS
jgi:hypothetical protein